jgi:hypothetical protein
MPRAGQDRRVEAGNQIGASTSPQIKFVRFLYEKELAEIAAKHAAANGNGSHEPLRYCHCAELVIAGHRIPAPKFHSCNYVVQRNGLIRDAERIATGKVCGAIISHHEKAILFYIERSLRGWNPRNHLPQRLLRDAALPNSAPSLHPGRVVSPGDWRD